MGFWSKKDKQAEEDARSALFGNTTSAAPPQQNPYSAPPPPYQATPHGAPPPTDNNRNALFSGRQPQGPPAQYGRQPPPPQQGPSAQYSRQQPPPQAGGHPRPGGYSQGDNTNRQLTAEEEEEEDVESIKQQIRFTKQESVSSTRNALRVAAQAEETGRNTLARLGHQGERLYNTEKNLDLASSHNRVAEERARELKTLNGSMFAVHIKNPMKSKSRAQAEEQRILDRHQAERDERETTRQAGYESRGRVGKALGGAGGGGGYMAGGAKMSAAERSRYQFENDESDDEKEQEIHNNLDQLGAITGRLRGLALATGEEVDRQNAHIDKIMKKSDNVDNQIAVTHNRLKKIR